MLLLILLTAVFLRFWQLGAWPPGLYRDEAFNGLDALRVLNGEHALFFPANNGREPAFIYLTAAAVALFGRSVWAVRLPAAVIGTLTTWLTYKMGAAWFDQRVGLFAAWLWAVTLWPVHLSRIGLRPVLLAAALALTGWLAARAVRRPTWHAWLLAGAAYGLSFYTYLAARMTPLLLVLFAVYLWLFHRHTLQKQRRDVWQGVCWFGVGTAVLLLPWLALFIQEPALLLGRSGQVSILNPAINQGDLWGTLLRQIGRGLGMFFWQGDTILRHNPAGRPVFDAVTAVFFLVGLGWCLRHWRRPFAGLLLLSIGVMLLPTILAEDTPHFLRASGLLPAIVLPPAIGLAQLWQLPRLPRRLRQGIVLLGALAALAFAVRDYAAYAQDPETALLFEAAAVDMARQINAESAETAVYLDRWFWDDDSKRGWPAIPFLATRQNVIAYRPEFGAPPPAPGQPVSVYAWQFGDLSFLRTLAAPLLANPPLAVQITPGQPARNDLQTNSFPLGVRYHLAPAAAPPPLLADFGNGLRLRESTVTLSADGRTAKVTMAWEAETAVPPNLVAFVHVLDAAGLAAQADAPPAQGLWLPDLWQPGIIVSETRTIPLPTAWQNGDYRVQVGVYDRETAVRLPAAGPDGAPLGDAVPLPPAAGAQP